MRLSILLSRPRKRQILGADFVERSHDAALEEALKALNPLRTPRTPYGQMVMHDMQSANRRGGTKRGDEGRLASGDPMPALLFLARYHPHGA